MHSCLFASLHLSFRSQSLSIASRNRPDPFISFYQVFAAQYEAHARSRKIGLEPSGFPPTWAACPASPHSVVLPWDLRSRSLASFSWFSDLFANCRAILLETLRRLLIIWNFSHSFYMLCRSDCHFWYNISLNLFVPFTQPFCPNGAFPSRAITLLICYYAASRSAPSWAA